MGSVLCDFKNRLIIFLHSFSIWYVTLRQLLQQETGTINFTAFFKTFYLPILPIINPDHFIFTGITPFITGSLFSWFSKGLAAKLMIYCSCIYWIVRNIHLPPLMRRNSYLPIYRKDVKKQNSVKEHYNIKESGNYIRIVSLKLWNCYKGSIPKLEPISK